MSPKGIMGKRSCEAKVIFQGPFGKENPVASQAECLSSSAVTVPRHLGSDVPWAGRVVEGPIFGVSRNQQLS